MTNFEILGAVKQAASEKLFHIIIEAHRAGNSPHQSPEFAECLAIVQAVEIATTVAHKFDGQSAGSNTGQRADGQSHDSEGQLEGTSFQINQNTLKEGDEMDRPTEPVARTNFT
jgi:hypothetical protein